MRKPNEHQQTEWFESPVTAYYFSLLSRLHAEVKEELAEQGFDTASAEQLQAHRGHLWGIRTTLETMIGVAESQSFREMEEDDEPIGDLPEGRQDIDSAGGDREDD